MTIVHISYPTVDDNEAYLTINISQQDKAISGYSKKEIKQIFVVYKAMIYYLLDQYNITDRTKKKNKYSKILIEIRVHVPNKNGVFTPSSSRADISVKQ